MTILSIFVATLAAGIGSVWLAAALMRFGLLRGSAGHDLYLGPQHLLSLAAGALLATSFIHLLPEAFESQASPQALFTTLLVGLVFFFLLDKAELWHHGHEHHHADGHGHSHDHAQEPAHGQGPGYAPGHEHALAPSPVLHSHERPLRSGGWAVLAGDSVHCFGDGVLIASAFMANPRLGWVAALAVLAHEVPHHIGDLSVMRMSSGTRRSALVKVSLAGAVTPLGGAAGFWLLAHMQFALPFFLAIASSSFIYVALADLIPQLQRRLSARGTAIQVAWLLAGIALVTLASRLGHMH